MNILNKVNKAGSSMAWTCPEFSITAKDAPLWEATGLLKVHGNRAILQGTATTVGNFSKDPVTGEYTVPAGNRLSSVNGQLAEGLLLLNAQQESAIATAAAKKELMQLI